MKRLLLTCGLILALVALACANEYYDHGSFPTPSSPATSAAMRAELDLIEAGFTKLPPITGNAGKAVIVNGGATALGLTTGTLTLPGNFATSGAFGLTLTVTGATTVTLPTTGTLATLAGAESLTNKTLPSPTFSGTASGSLTNLALTTPALTGNVQLTSTSLPVLSLNTTHGSNFASQLQFKVSGTAKWVIASDLNQDGTNTLTIYDAASSLERLKIDNAGVITLPAGSLAGATISTPVFSGTATGTYTLAGTPTLASPTFSGTMVNPDTVFSVVGSSDATKKLAFQVDGLTTGTTRTITIPDRDTEIGPHLVVHQASTSGTSIDFTGIPAGVKRITIEFIGVGTNGTDDVWVQLGDAGGVEATGYAGAKSILAATVSTTRITTAFGVSGSAGAAVLHGTVTLTLENEPLFTWVQSGSLARSDADFLYLSAGSKSLSAVLDRVRITTGGGVNTFDAGAIAITYE